MSVNTTASEMIDEAVELIHQAANIIGRILGEQPWGADDYDKLRLAKWYMKILEAKTMPPKES